MSETTNGIVIDYKDLTHSNYPRQEDKLMDFHDPSDEEAKWKVFRLISVLRS